MNNLKNHRRDFLKKTIVLSTVAAFPGINLLSGCGEKEGQDKDVSPPEDLMQEHGVLNRILLIYDCCKIKIVNNESFDVKSINDSATIIRTFIEDYHEKQEEDYLFSRFQKAKIFGENGFDSVVNRIAEIEIKLGIYELAQFTPTL